MRQTFCLRGFAQQGPISSMILPAKLLGPSLNSDESSKLAAPNFLDWKENGSNFELLEMIFHN